MRNGLAQAVLSVFIPQPYLQGWAPCRIFFCGTRKPPVWRRDGDWQVWNGTIVVWPLAGRGSALHQNTLWSPFLRTESVTVDLPANPACTVFMWMILPALDMKPARMCNLQLAEAATDPRRPVDTKVRTSQPGPTVK